jgi:hypothetical protein
VLDVYEHFRARELYCREMSLVPESSFDELFSEELGSEGRRGIMWGNLVLTGNAFLNVFEYVVVEGGEWEGDWDHREEYGYFLVIDGIEVWGYDRDLVHSPADRGHTGRDRKRVPAARVSFKAVVQNAWRSVEAEEEVRALR